MAFKIELHPTGLVPEALSAQVLNFMNEGTLGLLGLAAAADVVAAGCRRNYWVATALKEVHLSEEQRLCLLETEDVVDDKCWSAMAAFRAGGTREALLDELAAVAVTLNDRSV
jgi:hypothetical protein